MALQQAKIIPSLREKRYYTLQLLEAATIGGNKVKITPVASHSVTELSGETFSYDPYKAVEAYIIFEERPKVSLLKSLGWFREDGETQPIAYIPTHVLRNYTTQREYKTDDFFVGLCDDPTANRINDNVIIRKGTKIKIKPDELLYDIDNLHMLTEEQWRTDVVNAQNFSLFYQEGPLFYFRYNPDKEPLLIRDLTRPFPDSFIVFEDDEVKFDPVEKELTYKGDNEWHLTRIISYLDEDAFVEYEHINTGYAFQCALGEITTCFETDILGDVANYYTLQNLDITELVNTGKTDSLILDELPIIRGTKIDVSYDFLPDVKNPLDPFGSKVKDLKGTTNSFFVSAVRVDTVSLNYIVKLVPFQDSISKESTAKVKDDLNSVFIKFDSNNAGF